MKNANVFDPSQALQDIMMYYGGKGLYDISWWTGIKTIDRNLIEALARRADELEFDAESNKSNIVYRNREVGSVLILSGEDNKNQFFTPVDEKHYVEKIKGHAVQLNNKMEKGKLVLRPAIWKNGAWVYLWKVVYPNDKVDHITRCHLMNTEEELRPCTSLQNEYNKPRHKANKDVFSVTIETEKIEEITELLMKEGINTYRIDSYKSDKSCATLNITFPAYQEENEFFRVSKIIRDCIEGEFQYDPIIACETVLYMLLYLEWKFFGELTEEEHRRVKLYLLSLTQDGRDKLKYYCLEEVA